MSFGLFRKLLRCLGIAVLVRDRDDGGQTLDALG